MDTGTNTNIIHEAAKVSPSIFVSGMVLLQQNISEIAVVLTIIYTIIMIFITIRDKILKPLFRKSSKYNDIDEMLTKLEAMKDSMEKTK
jgi:hypothetical protein